MSALPPTPREMGNGSTENGAAKAAHSPARQAVRKQLEPSIDRDTMKTLFSIVILLGLIAGGGFYYVKYYRGETGTAFKTAPVERGSMLPTIEATGTVEPEQVVDIGSQVNGLVTDLKADYGSDVEAGAVLALIDKTLYQATVDQNRALVNSSTASLALGKANLHLAEENLKRDVALLKTKGALALNQYDTDQAAVEVSKAQVGVQEAAIKQAEATLRQSEVNLGYCDIKSPVKGTIVDRRVNIGQTVVSSLSASSLFLLAKDLTRIQVWASVNEADIGRIRKGLTVRFTVDAYPNDTFVGEVAQIRLNATMTQNVVTYTVVVTTENKEKKLLPYMTASLHFETAKHEGILKVPNAALRWKPTPKEIAPDIRAATVAAMNRTKKTDDSTDDADGTPADGKPADGKPAQQPKSSIASAPASSSTVSSGTVSSGTASSTAPAASSGAIATSGGTATGLNPEDWKARTDNKNVQAEKTPQKPAGADKKSPQQSPDKAAKAATPGVPAAAADRQPPGRPISTSEAAALKEHFESGRLWVIDGNYVKPVHVKIIATDGTMTEVRGSKISEGMDVVTGENVATDTDDATNPFMPKLLRGGGTKPK
jgi:HlyD family secretion protein